MAETLLALNREIIDCSRCPRLRTYAARVAEQKRRAYRDWTYWGRPVPSFGDEQARVLLLGLAPGAHGSNRTGRPFTGDGSGNFLYPALHETGFASQPRSTSIEDGMRLRDLWISAAVRCAPPENRPSREELRNCSGWLDEEARRLKQLRVVVCLGRIAFEAWLAHALRTGRMPSGRGCAFRHGAEYRAGDQTWLLASYHPSLQNTNTGRLTMAMFVAVLRRARELAGLEAGQP